VKSAVRSLKILGICVHILSSVDCDDGNSMMAMVMMIMLIVLVMGIVVPEALREVDSVHQHSCQTIQKHTHVHCPNALCGKPNSFRSMDFPAAALKYCCVMETSSRL